LAARAVDDLRGQNTVVLDLTEITPIVDYFVVTTGTSSRQMRAMAEEAHRALKQAGSRRLGLEGEESSTWILQDYGDVVVHIFTAEGRSLYDLERLWADAPQIDWKLHCPPSARPAAATVPEAQASATQVSEPEEEPQDLEAGPPDGPVAE
jgi:ribosome-associated protein